MSRLSDFRHGIGRRASHGLRVPISQVKNLRLTMSRNAAFALIFCLGVCPLFAEEQSTKATGDKTKEMFERAMAQAESATAISHRVKDIFARAGKAVVKIHGVDEHSEICGTGFFIDPTGTLYTAYTVGGEAGNFTIEFGGKKYPARQLLADIRSGTAMLKIDEATPALPIGKSEQLEVATPVVSIGFPLDLPETPNFGMVAGFDRKYLGRYFSTTHMRLNLPSQRGEAGAPLLNMKGEVVGIVVSSLENNAACYAVPIEAAEKLRGDFMRFGEARHGWVGINVSMARQPVEGSLAEMTQIMEETPAARSGVVLHHSRRRCPNHCDARESKIDFQRAGHSSSRQQDWAVTCLSRHAGNESAGDPALARFRRAAYAVGWRSQNSFRPRATDSGG